MKYALLQAKNNNFDLFNSLDIMRNQEFIERLKFMPGDGYLHYYLYNWNVNKKFAPNEIGFLLV